MYQSQNPAYCKLLRFFHCYAYRVKVLFYHIETGISFNFCFSTAWHNQPYSLGSYTSIGVGGQQTDIERLAEPMFQRPNNRTVSSDALWNIQTSEC